MSTFAELDLKAKRYRVEQIEGWRKVRWLGTILVNLHSKRKVSQEQLLKLPDEEEKDRSVMSRERFEKLKKLWSN